MHLKSMLDCNARLQLRNKFKEDFTFRVHCRNSALLAKIYDFVHFKNFPFSTLTFSSWNRNWLLPTSFPSFYAFSTHFDAARGAAHGVGIFEPVARPNAAEFAALHMVFRHSSTHPRSDGTVFHVTHRSTLSCIAFHALPLTFDLLLLLHQRTCAALHMVFHHTSHHPLSDGTLFHSGGWTTSSVSQSSTCVVPHTPNISLASCLCVTTASTTLSRNTLSLSLCLSSTPALSVSRR